MGKRPSIDTGKLETTLRSTAGSQQPHQRAVTVCKVCEAISFFTPSLLGLAVGAEAQQSIAYLPEDFNEVVSLDLPPIHTCPLEHVHHLQLICLQEVVQCDKSLGVRCTDQGNGTPLPGPAALGWGVLKSIQRCTLRSPLPRTTLPVVSVASPG